MASSSNPEEKRITVTKFILKRIHHLEEDAVVFDDEKCATILKLTNKFNIDLLYKLISLSTSFVHGFTSSQKGQVYKDKSRCSLFIELLKATPKGCLELFQHAINLSEFKSAEDYLKYLTMEVVKEEIDINSILPSSLRGNAEERNYFIIFVQKIIELGVNPNGLQQESHSLDVILKMPDDYRKEKMKLLSILIEHGADIRHCKYAENAQTTLLHIATELALKSGTTNVYCIGYNYCDTVATHIYTIMG